MSFIENFFSVSRIEDWPKKDSKDERICFLQLQLPMPIHPYHRSSCKLTSVYSHLSVFKVLREQLHFWNLPLFLLVNVYHNDLTADVNISHCYDFQWILVCTIWSIVTAKHNLLCSGHRLKEEAKCQKNTQSKTRKIMGPFLNQKKLMYVQFGEH